LVLEVVLEFVIVHIDGNDLETGKDHRGKKGKSEDGFGSSPA